MKICLVVSNIFWTFIQIHDNMIQCDFCILMVTLVPYFSDGLKPPTRICFFLCVFLFQNIFCERSFLVNVMWSYEVFWEYLLIDEPGFQRQKNIEMFDVSAWNMPNFVPKLCLRYVISLNVLCLQIDDHQQYEEMFISYAHPFMGVWRVGYQRAKGIIELTKLNDLLWSQCYWDTLSQTHTACVLMTILWNGGTAVWWYDPSSMSHVALPGFLHEFCWQAEDENWWEVWWIWVCWVRFSHVLVKEIHDAWGKENYIYIWYDYICICVRIYIYVYTNWSKLFVPFHRDSVCLTLADI